MKALRRNVSKVSPFTRAGCCFCTVSEEELKLWTSWRFISLVNCQLCRYKLLWGGTRDAVRLRTCSLLLTYSLRIQHMLGTCVGLWGTLPSLYGCWVQQDGWKLRFHPPVKVIKTAAIQERTCFSQSEKEGSRSFGEGIEQGLQGTIWGSLKASSFGRNGWAPCSWTSPSLQAALSTWGWSCGAGGPVGTGLSRCWILPSLLQAPAPTPGGLCWILCLCWDGLGGSTHRQAMAVDIPGWPQ